MHIAPDDLERGYVLLKGTLPFRRWKLPDPDDVVFEAKTIDRPATDGSQGQHWHDGTHHHIGVNPARHRTLGAMLLTLAHELCHLRAHDLGETSYHGQIFHKLADLTCRHHGFDRGQF